MGHLFDPSDLRFVNPYWEDVRDTAEWCRDNSEEDAIIITPHTHQVYAVSCRQAMNSERTDFSILNSSSHFYAIGPIEEVDPKLIVHKSSRFQKISQSQQVRLIKKIGMVGCYLIDGTFTLDDSESLET
ncbi:MAG: hypothetical protein COA78_09085 [Blastopirellula sp.]|nr:MAG: hypothetical protein COA78_09085 [Blastopirellula sp.]